MKLFICSDLHIDYLTSQAYDSFSFPEADAYLIAGDHMNGVVEKHYQWLINKTHGKPTYLSPGNHDYYGSDRATAISQMRKLTQGSNIQVIFNEAVELAPGLQLWASDFWTDMNLTGSIEDVIEVSKTQWDDFDLTYQVVDGKQIPLTPEATLVWHQDAINQFMSYCQKTEDAVILMSHHGLFKKSLARDLTCRPLSAIDALFTSELSDQILGLKNPPILAINGHIHTYNRCWLTDSTALYCNPRGNDGAFKHTLIDVFKRSGRYCVSFL